MLGHLAVGKFSSSGSAYLELFVCWMFVFVSLLHPASPNLGAVVALYCSSWTKAPSLVTLCWKMMANAELRSVFFPLGFPHTIFPSHTSLSQRPLSWQPGLLQRRAGSTSPSGTPQHWIQESVGWRGMQSTPCAWGQGAQQALPVQSPRHSSPGAALCWHQPTGPLSLTRWICSYGGKGSREAEKVLSSLT